MPIITVPPIPPGSMPSSWRRVVTGIWTSRSGNTTTLLPDDGTQWLSAGDTVQVPAGTVILTVDKAHTGYATTYREGERYATYAPTVAVLTVAEDGTLAETFRRSFKTAKAVLAATVLGKLRAVLDGAPEGVIIQVLAEAQRPNRSAGECRWCGQQVPAGQGHLHGHGEDTRVEHWLECPTQPATDGDHRAPCAVCGVSVHHTLGVRVVQRPASGPAAGGPTIVIRHRPDLDCANQPQPAAELIDAELAYEDAQRRELEAAARESLAKKQAAADKRKAAAAEKRRLRDAEARRQAEAARDRYELTGVAYTDPEQELYDKSLGDGARMRLTQTVAHLKDGGDPVTYWTVTSAHLGISRVFWLLSDARSFYQGYKFEPDRSRTPSPVRRVDTAACPDVRHCDECGSTEAVGGWMGASLGLACGVDCYDAMADRPGRHARTHHRR